MKPAKEVGGDYYDFIVHEGTKRSITVCIGDVSGKGVGAGIVMAMARSALRSLVQRDKVPKSTLPLVQGLNTHLCADIPRGMFMTLNVLNWEADTQQAPLHPCGTRALAGLSSRRAGRSRRSRPAASRAASSSSPTP